MSRARCSSAAASTPPATSSPSSAPPRSTSPTTPTLTDYVVGAEGPGARAGGRRPLAGRGAARVAPPRARRSPAGWPYAPGPASSPTPSTSTPTSWRASRSSAASTVVRSSVTHGTPIITVRPNSTPPVAAPAAAQRVDVAVDAQRRRQGRPRRRAGRQGEGRPPRPDGGVDRRLRRAAGRTGTSRSSRRSPTPCTPRSARPAPPPTRAGTRTRTRSARPARRSRRSSTSRAASPGRSSTGPACRRRRRSWPSTRTPRRRSSSWSTSASSATCSRSIPQLTAEIEKRKA